VPHDPNYHSMADMTDQAIKWVKAQKSLTPDRPFFICFAPGATHAPHHVRKEWIGMARRDSIRSIRGHRARGRR
jgi:arylsulfatase A-like enzyme